jgi:hypothetical protein
MYVHLERARLILWDMNKKWLRLIFYDGGSNIDAIIETNGGKLLTSTSVCCCYHITTIEREKKMLDA